MYIVQSRKGFNLAKIPNLLIVWIFVDIYEENEIRIELLPSSSRLLHKHKMANWYQKTDVCYYFHKYDIFKDYNRANVKIIKFLIKKVVRKILINPTASELFLVASLAIFHPKQLRAIIQQQNIFVKHKVQTAITSLNINACLVKINTILKCNSSLT